MDERFKTRECGQQSPVSRKSEPSLTERGIYDISEYLPDSPEDTVEEEKRDGLADFPEDEALSITSVESLKKQKYRYLIRFGPHDLEVHEDVMIKYRMIKGNSFTKYDLLEIIAADEKQQAYVEALNYLSRKPRTSKEISVRLKEKGREEGIIQETVARLEKEGLINDALYAQEWAAQRVRNRGKGKMWVRQELRQKGVSKPLIEEALGGVPEEEEYDSALAMGAKKWRQTSGEVMDRKRKTGAYLMRRGFSGALVSRVLRSLIQDQADSEEEEADLDRLD
ncbi:regulatory protein RecX [Paenibacillus sp. J22TS3]|uniref:regulatory protein RecX n=1 Tax=Paenibacillus sp. J22TS3 TaxID=2807192 RepID=UPI001B098215|nr:RecX family transcriptional regulator [Paenibacillus sp. J22TS3]GIP21502.1 hypothetical protein J22TS3_17770 [Paenibacillus sp. J22TS3]